MACVFLPCIGGLAYILVGRRHASKEKIDVFERYGKKDSSAAPAEQEAPKAEPEVVESEKAFEDDPLPEGRARAPWDDEPAEKAESPRPVVKEWDFGCPEDARKN
jgi:hypothetical protein